MIHWKLCRAFGTNPDPFISGDVCGYLQPHFDEAVKLFHKLGKVVALITVHSRLPSMNVHDLVYWMWKEVIFLANIFYMAQKLHVTANLITDEGIWMVSLSSV